MPKKQTVLVNHAKAARRQGLRENRRRDTEGRFYTKRKKESRRECQISRGDQKDLSRALLGSEGRRSVMKRDMTVKVERSLKRKI